MMNKVKIIQAHVGNLDTLMDWRMEVLGTVFGKAYTKSEKLYAENKRYYEKALTDNSHVAVFASIGKLTVGCGGVCFYQEMPSPDNPTGQCAYLMNIYVRPPYRNRGVGKTVIEYLVREAQKRKITKIYLESTKKALPLYEAIGFSPMEDYLKYD